MRVCERSGERFLPLAAIYSCGSKTAMDRDFQERLDVA
jgi:hypothetical protein